MGELIQLKKNEEPVLEEPTDAFSCYLAETRKHPLLTKKEELNLAIKIEEHHQNIFYAICDYDRENQEHFGLVAIKGRIRKRYSVKKREEILEKGSGCLKENETYRVISNLEKLLDKTENSNEDREEIYNQMFKELYFSEDTLGQINRNLQNHDDNPEIKVNSYREVIRETATNLIPEMENNILFYENEMEKSKDESSRDYFKEKIDQNVKVKEYLQNQLQKEFKSREYFINSNLRLVISIAKRFMDRGPSLEELIPEGNLGLMKAVDSFDHTKNYKFSTYATWWVKQYVNRGIAHLGKCINIPVHVHEFNAQCYGAEVELMHILGKQPGVEELAKYMYHQTLSDKVKKSMSFEKLVNAIKKSKIVNQHEYSFDSEFKSKNEKDEFSGIGIPLDKTGIMVELARKTPGPEESYVQQELSESIRDVLATLTPREEKIIRKRFGIGEEKRYTLDEIKVDFGVTRERIRQLEAKALEKLRLPSRKKRLKQFW
ncbi:sigma-70 family RNA polymerase sigma factor [Candidatus Woesearchaeota archaeon]|jgi:RNA polymerase primary sigma factor|nr:sigma-70 family RNA polymerase sigma factor [Candidatus Woesearchaeota archaeon]